MNVLCYIYRELEGNQQTVTLKAQDNVSFCQDHPYKGDGHIYEPLEDFTKMYDEVSVKETSPPKQASKSNHNNIITDTISEISNRASPSETLPPEQAPESDNDPTSIVYEDVILEEPPNLKLTAAIDCKAVKEHPLKESESSSTAQALTSHGEGCLLYTSPSPRDATLSRMPSSA